MAKPRKTPPETVDVADSYAVRLMQHLVVPTFVIDPKRRVVIWNRACERLTGVAASEVIGTNKHWQAFYETKRPCLADLVALDRPEQLPEFYSEYAARGHNGLGFSAENWCVMPKLGSQLYLAIDAGPIHDEAGNLIAVVETLRDLTDQKRAEMALKELATKDGLTGLVEPPLVRPDADDRMGARAADAEAAGAAVRRRRSFQAVQRRARPPDRRRMPARGRARRQPPCGAPARPRQPLWRRGIRADPARHGCDDACAIAEEIRGAVWRCGSPMALIGAGNHVTLSVGVASHIPGEADGAPDRLLGAADQALYAAKRLGRNRVVCSERILAEFAGLGRDNVPVSGPVPGLAPRKSA